MFKLQNRQIAFWVTRTGQSSERMVNTWPGIPSRVAERREDPKDVQPLEQEEEPTSETL